MYCCCKFIAENFTMLRNFHPNLTSNCLPQCCMIWSSTFECIPRWNQVAFSASQYSQNEILDLLYTGLLCFVLCIVSSLNKSFVQSGLSSAQIVLGHIGTAWGTKTLFLKGTGYKNIPSNRCIIASSSFRITIALLLC